MEEHAYVYQKAFKGEGGKPIRYEVSGEAFFTGAHSTSIRTLPKYPHTKPYGIDKVSISLPRDYLDEDAFNNLKLRKSISRHLFISSKGGKVWISFQRELFDETQSYLVQVKTILYSLYEKNGLFKFPLTKRTVYDDGRKKEEVYPSISNPEGQLKFLYQHMMLEELEVFFDHDISILSSLRYLPGEVNSVYGTLYSNDYEKKQKGLSKKSFAKVYNKIDAQRAHSRKVSVLEDKYPLRIELTLSKDKMAYMGMKGLDYPADEIISLLSDALAKGLHEGAPWLKSLKGDPLLNTKLSEIMAITPKKRLRVSREVLRKTKGDASNPGSLGYGKDRHLRYFRKWHSNDEVLSTWDNLPMRKNHEGRSIELTVKTENRKDCEKGVFFKPLSGHLKDSLRQRIYIKEWSEIRRGPLGSTGPPFGSTLKRVVTDSS